MAKIIGNTTTTPIETYTKSEIDGMFSAKIEAKIENNILVIDDMLSAKIEAKIENNILVIE